MFDPTQFERLPPHSVETEMCFLCAMVLVGRERDRDRLMELRRSVRPDDFFQADHQILFRTMAEMIDRSKPVDLMLLREELDRRQLLEEIGGIDYLMAIATAAPSYANGLGYAEIIREKATWRRVIAVCHDVLRQAWAPAKDDRSIEAARAAATALSDLAMRGFRDTVVTLGDAALKVLDRRSDPQIRRIPTGIGSLDEVIGGLPKSKTTLVGADPRVGKSALIKQILGNQARAGVTVGLVTVEEDQEKVAENQLASQSGVANFAIAHGSLGDADWDRVEGAALALAELPFYIQDQAYTLDDVVATIERLALKYKCEVIGVDHLHLIRAAGESREQEVSRVSAALKATFKRLNVAGVVAVQLNRGQDVREKPTLRNLRGSGSLEADGDIILLLYREDVWRYNERGYEPSFMLEVNVAKNKDGRMGEVPLGFDGEHQTVTERPPPDVPW